MPKLAETDSKAAHFFLSLGIQLLNWGRSGAKELA